MKALLIAALLAAAVTACTEEGFAATWAVNANGVDPNAPAPNYVPRHDFTFKVNGAAVKTESSATPNISTTVEAGDTAEIEVCWAIVNTYPTPNLISPTPHPCATARPPFRPASGTGLSITITY